MNRFKHYIYTRISQQNKYTDNINKQGGKRQSKREKEEKQKKPIVFSKSKQSERECEGVERDRSRTRGWRECAFHFTESKAHGKAVAITWSSSSGEKGY